MFIILIFFKKNNLLMLILFTIFMPNLIFLFAYIFWLHNKQQKVKNNNTIFPKHKSFTKLLN